MLTSCPQSRNKTIFRDLLSFKKSFPLYFLLFFSLCSLSIFIKTVWGTCEIHLAFKTFSFFVLVFNSIPKEGEGNKRLHNIFEKGKLFSKKSQRMQLLMGAIMIEINTLTNAVNWNVSHHLCAQWSKWTDVWRYPHSPGLPFFNLQIAFQ